MAEILHQNQAVLTQKVDNDIQRIIKGFSQLQVSPMVPMNSGSTTPAAASRSYGPMGYQAAPRPMMDRPRNCVICESTEHSRGRCHYFMKYLDEGVIALNERNLVVLKRTGEEVRVNYGGGGMLKSGIEEEARMLQDGKSGKRKDGRNRDVSNSRAVFSSNETRVATGILG
jgi:hypothetical protein